MVQGPPAQEFSPSWNARKRVQERVEIPGNSRKSIVSKNVRKNGLKAGILKKNKTTFTLTTSKVVRVKVVLFFLFFHLKGVFRTLFDNTDFLEFPEIFSLKQASEKHLKSGKIEKMRPLLL